GDHLLEQRLARVGLQIEGKAALVGIEHQKEQAVAVRIAQVAPSYVAALGLLELDHVGTEKSQDLRAGGTRLVVRHIDDADTGQGLLHSRAPRWDGVLGGPSMRDGRKRA